MRSVSGFTFIHNGIEGGYPFIEAIDAVYPYVDELVVVDMESTDATDDVISNAMTKYHWDKIRIIPGPWTPGAAGECLKAAHALHSYCRSDIIWHFEADEVFDINLACYVWQLVKRQDFDNVMVPRIQVEQNFQRVRWWPEHVHRVFRKGAIKSGHTTVEHQDMAFKGKYEHVSDAHGYLWDVTNCFRDNWKDRYLNQAELWGHPVQYRWVGLHANHGMHTTGEDGAELDELLRQPHWTSKNAPMSLPMNLRSLVGVTDYVNTLYDRGLL